MKWKIPLAKLLPVLGADVQKAVAEHVPDIDGALLIRKGTARDPGNYKFADGERAAVRYVSTRDIDRDGEIMDPAGAMLADFRLAPVVLWGHDYSQPPIGSDEWIKADAFGIKAKTIYAETPRAEEVWQLVKAGHLRTSSVGFIPLEAVAKGGDGWSETVKRLSEKWEVTKKSIEAASRIITKWLLLEHSDVSVPSNINALNLAVAKGLSLSEDMRGQLGVVVIQSPSAVKVIGQEPVKAEPEPVKVIEVVNIPRSISVVGPQVDIVEVVREVLDEHRGRVV